MRRPWLLYFVCCLHGSWAISALLWPLSANVLSVASVLDRLPGGTTQSAWVLIAITILAMLGLCIQKHVTAALLLFPQNALVITTALETVQSLQRGATQGGFVAVTPYSFVPLTEFSLLLAVWYTVCLWDRLAGEWLRPVFQRYVLRRP